MKYKTLLIIIAIFSLFLAIYPNKAYAINDSDIQQDIYNNYEKDSVVSCGKNSKGTNPLISNIPKSIPKVTNILYLGILIAVPIVLVIFGMLDLFKGLSAQKEDEIRKGQQIFVKRLIAAGLIFFVFMIVKLVIGFASDKTAGKVLDCAECFIENNCH